MVVAGMGVQGHKRVAVAGNDVVAIVDPVTEGVDFKDIEEVPLDAYDAVLACIPDQAKMAVLGYLLENGKHVLVEKPILADDEADIRHLQDLAKASGAVCYTAYNHRFEPHFVRMKNLITSGALGRIYTLRMFYGNGTARLVRDSAWRDEGAGVLPDLGSHLLDTLLFWIGAPKMPFAICAANRFENRAFDHVVLGSEGKISIELEMTLLSWRNHFTCDVLAEKGSAHIQSLCKWGPSTFRHRTRVLPSGRPQEEEETLERADPTWALEYAHFKSLCAEGGPSNLDNDLWINGQLNRLGAQALGRAAA
jgi:predicted dehydrogenase|tara:strand:+ start:994 stop:1917 length:924 start_codon:yes stop_codon:yes gene_type:complete